MDDITAPADWPKQERAAKTDLIEPTRQPQSAGFRRRQVKPKVGYALFIDIVFC